MPKVPVDFSKVSSFEPIPTGIYDLRVMKVEEKEKNDGTGTYLNLEFKVEEGEFEGRKLWLICSLAIGDNGFPKGMWIMKAINEAAGLDMDISELDTDDWIGVVVKAEVTKEYDSYRDADRNNIKKFLS
jgi:hypothetical protein